MGSPSLNGGRCKEQISHQKSGSLSWRAALFDLTRTVKAISGCEGIDLPSDHEQPNRFLFIERWTSIEAHVAGGKQLFAPVAVAVKGAPEASDLDYQLSLS